MDNLLDMLPEAQGYEWNDESSIAPQNPGPVVPAYLFELGFYTDPLNSDTDGDGFADGDEVNIYHTLPNSAASKPSPFLKALGFSFRLGFRFSVIGDLDSSARIETSSNMVDWASLMSLKLGSSPLVVTDPTATNYLGTRFYRAVRLPQG